MIEKFLHTIGCTDCIELTSLIQIRNQYFLCPFQENVRFNDDLRFAGIYLGEKREGSFSPSPECIGLISTKAKSRVRIERKAEWLFLCGRDLFMTSIVENNSCGDIVFVFNEYDENIGYGRKKGNIIKNLLDKGSYLRMEKG